MQMICVNFDHNISLLDTSLPIFDLLAFPFVFVFSQEYQAFSVASRRDKHHLNHVLIVKLLMVSDLSHKSILLVALPHWIVMLNEVINQVCRVQDLLLVAFALQGGEISTTFQIAASAHLIEVEFLIGDDSGGL